jgi:hypothetical protein
LVQVAANTPGRFAKLRVAGSIPVSRFNSAGLTRQICGKEMGRMQE